MFVNGAVQWTGVPIQGVSQPRTRYFRDRVRVQNKALTHDEDYLVNDVEEGLGRAPVCERRAEPEKAVGNYLVLVLEGSLLQ